MDDPVVKATIVAAIIGAVAVLVSGFIGALALFLVDSRIRRRDEKRITLEWFLRLIKSSRDLIDLFLERQRVILDRQNPPQIIANSPQDRIEKQRIENEKADAKLFDVIRRMGLARNELVSAAHASQMILGEQGRPLVRHVITLYETDSTNAGGPIAIGVLQSRLLDRMFAVEEEMIRAWSDLERPSLVQTIRRWWTKQSEPMLNPELGPMEPAPATDLPH